MNGKIIAVIAIVAVVVIAGAGVGIYFLLKDKGGDPETDYTLIDSTSNIKAGMTIKEKTESSKQNSDVTYKVTKVEGGTVTFTQKVKGTNSAEGILVLEQFDPDKYASGIYILAFDYRDSTLPEGINVTKEGNVYTINGTYSVKNPVMGIEQKFTDLKITIDSDVTAVNGKFTNDMDLAGEYYSNSSYDLNTADSKLKGTVDVSSYQEKTDGITAFYSHTLMYFTSSYKSIATSEPSKYGNVDTTKYTLNGVASEINFKDVVMQVYKDYILYGSGTADGEDFETKTDIFIA